MTLTAVFHKLRRHNSKNYVLYLFCNFISLLLLTAYSGMIFSPTVLSILPEGGDSRKQIYMIFAMACIGCLVFTIYAAALFYRMKSREIGTMMLLGASRKVLARAMLREVALLSSVSSLVGAVLGLPLAWLIWRLFRLLIIDSPEMTLHFDFRCLFLSVVFVIFVIATAFLLGLICLKKTNIMDVVNTAHKNEPLPRSRKWFGAAGVLLLLFGAVFGYNAPVLYMKHFQAYPPAWINLAYGPVFIGLYLFLLHVVTSGFNLSRRKKYKGLIARSMMKFQGRQTVNSMMVVTVLIAGGLFAAFYLPMMGSGQVMANEVRSFDYGVRYPFSMAEAVPDRDETVAMAQAADLSGVKDWRQAEVSYLGVSGNEQVEDDGGKFHYEYMEIRGGEFFLSESQFTALTKAECHVPAGQYLAVNSMGKTDSYLLSEDIDLITNMTTRTAISTRFGGYQEDSMLGERGYYILNDGDFAKVTRGLDDQWKERMVFFNSDGEDNYTFARSYFDAFVDAFRTSPAGKECERPSYYDRIRKIVENERGQTYWGDTDLMDQVFYKDRDSNGFRLYWAYMPWSKSLESHEFLKTMAVFLMMFLFIALICLAVAMIICYTRSITIAINNRYVFDDLKRLGASPAFLRREVRRQSFRIFGIPATVGCIMMYLLYSMIMYANDGAFTRDECLGLAVCLLVVLAVGAVICLIYRITLRQMLEKLDIQKK